jgi:hypothetical protein
MKALIVYESMYGNTHEVAEAIGRGLATTHEVEVVPVDGATAERLAGVDLLVVGGPTHVHGMTTRMSRKAAVGAAAEDEALTVDPDAEGEGLREWFDHLDGCPARGAAYDTRMEGPPALTGRASKGIARRLRHHGLEVVAEPESFLVDKANHLLDGEATRAEAWAATLT